MKARILLAVMAGLALSGCWHRKDEPSRDLYYPHFAPLLPEQRQSMAIADIRMNTGAVIIHGKVTRLLGAEIDIDDGTGTARVYLGPAYEGRHEIDLGTEVKIFGIQNLDTFFAREIAVGNGPFRPANY
jgi:hypothetical protein